MKRSELVEHLGDTYPVESFANQIVGPECEICGAACHTVHQAGVSVGGSLELVLLCRGCSTKITREELDRLMNLILLKT